MDRGRLDHTNATLVVVEVTPTPNGHKRYRLASQAGVIDKTYSIGDIKQEVALRDTRAPQNAECPRRVARHAENRLTRNNNARTLDYRHGSRHVTLLVSIEGRAWQAGVHA